MGKGSERNDLCPRCDSGKKYKNCCFYKPTDPLMTGEKAEDFVDFLSKKTFLKPWVFKSPRYLDGKEFSDVCVIFRDILILIEVKGNKFDPKNPQRYLKSAKDRHRQLLRAQGVAQKHSKQVRFKNEFFDFTTDFKDFNKIYLISVSTGPGEMEIAYEKENIDFKKLDYREVSKYLGFFDNETGIHSFTSDEFTFASKHIDTIKDFLWYLDFEKKFLSNDFSKTKKQGIIANVDTHREDLISIYILTYYWDEELNKTGFINLNKILGNEDKIEKADMVFYSGTDTREHLEDNDDYKAIIKEKEISYIWDKMINDMLSQYEFAYKISFNNPQKQKVNIKEMSSILEEMSFTSRLERSVFCEKIQESNMKVMGMRNMFSLSDDSHTLFSYSHIVYNKFPSPEEQEASGYKHLYSVWCRIKFAENLKPIKDRVRKTLLITKHSYKNISSYSFALSDEINVEEEKCKAVCVI